MLDSTLSDTTQAFLDEFGKALEDGDIARAREMFADDCYWRDLVTFTWNIKTVEGKDQVEDMLKHQLATTKPHNWTIAEGEVVTEDGGDRDRLDHVRDQSGARLWSDPAA